MKSNNEVLAIDAGNTAIKVGIFKDGELSETVRFMNADVDQFLSFVKEKSTVPSILTSVLSDKKTQEIISATGAIHLTTNTPTPLQMKYETGNTLGMDRLCNAVGVAAKTHTKHAVSIDVGTCIKFDLVTATNTYVGGSIAPGIDLRYKALNDYTGKLPLLSNKSRANLVGKSTNESIHSGVLNGMNAEINGLMNMYSSQFESLTFFVTGGDAKHFDLQSKNDIFADENLTLFGLFEIYKHNA